MDIQLDRNVICSDEIADKFARKFAVANNGGEWATHYTEEQKNVWRHRARQWIGEVLYEFVPKGVRA